MIRFLITAALFSIAAPAFAAGQVALSSDVKVEKTQLVDGRQQVVLAPAAHVLPGDRLVLRTTYRNTGAAAATRFVVTNPVPAAVAWTGDGSTGVEASIDGGRTFGALAALRVRGANGIARPAIPADVTHLRWTLASIAPGGAGQLSYRGVVR
ncbi:hypothetical protein [Sphingomonas sp.]|uniref:hypothetical protein n=1 Tax=Sphingomonas sp. TaxID=28214 RepID=UPI003CC6CF85